MEKYFKKVLNNNLRLIMVPEKSATSVTVMVLVGAGSKYEEKRESGISHFLEHMFFKGTKKRPSFLDVSAPIDSVGGSFNAFTSKEYTGYYARVASKHFDLALDWVSDILQNSTLAQKEVNKEKGVILEEIKMISDSPMKKVGCLWENLLYQDQPAGWDIIGNKETILKTTRNDLLKYFKEHYSAQNIIVCVSGNFAKEELPKKVERYFSSINSTLPKSKKPTVEQQEKPRSLLHFKKTDQTHFCLGARTFGLNDQRVFALEVLSTILGGNMSSRLFVEMREKRGLCYYVRTENEEFTDHGYLVSQVGCKHEKFAQSIALILKEYQRIKKQLVSAETLRQAKDYLLGSMDLDFENSSPLASFYAGQELLSGKILTVKQKKEKIEQVSQEDLGQLAKEIFQPTRLNLVAIGPHKDYSAINSLLKI